MIDGSVLRLDDDGGAAFVRPLPESRVITGEAVASRDGGAIEILTADGEWLQIGVVPEEYAGILRAEGMARIGRHGETEVRKSAPCRAESCHRQDQVIDCRLTRGC